MEIITGFAAARARLSRQIVIESGALSPAVQARLRAVFGREITAQQAVEQIIQDVKLNGDVALRHYLLQIEGLTLDSFEVTREVISRAHLSVDRDLLAALRLAAERIRRFHQEQMDHFGCGLAGEDWGQLVRPLARVGLYAPGGTASYPSTVLMTAIPASVAGVKEIVLATPARSGGVIPPVTLAAADIAGVDRVFSLGGAQAIAALALGTQTIPRVDKICGPGNLFVMLAKKLVFGLVDIDGLQGPSELLIIADETANPAWCAADLLAQAEHDSLSQVILVTPSQRLADEVQRELTRQAAGLPRNRIIGESLEHGAVIAVVDNLDEAIDLANLYAPEHLELMLSQALDCLDRITNAGCIFVGYSSTVPMGDYIMGPNHALPTGGTARFSSPLNVLDFVKFIDVVKLNSAGLQQLGRPALTLARAEGLEAHARAIEIRLPPAS